MLLSAWIMVPAAHAQFSSSAQYQQDFETLIQGEGPNRGGYTRQGYYPNQSNFSHIAIEAGGGFNRPVQYTRSFETWGGNVAIGGGWKFNEWFSTLAEWQFIDDKIPGAYLAKAGVPGGHVHTWGLTLEPTFSFRNDGVWGWYAFGGGGFYRRVTSYTVPQLQQVCYYFCGQQYVNVTVAHYSSNQGGINGGGGVTWKAFGADSNGKIYAEVRYVMVNSPKTNVFGTPDGKEYFVPVSIGFRW